MVRRKKQYNPIYPKKRYISNAVQNAKGTTYFDFLRTLSDEELQKQYKFIYSHPGDVRRKRIMNQFLIENDKLELIG